jgi:DNA-binding Xre family transcriptional regulator
MVLIDETLKKTLVDKINEILDLNDSQWNTLDRKMKFKYIHRLCSFLETENLDFFSSITIPLKSIKPKKLIQHCGISKTANSNLYSQFNNLILEYTKNFRTTYVDLPKRKFYSNY